MRSEEVACWKGKKLCYGESPYTIYEEYELYLNGHKEPRKHFTQVRGNPTLFQRYNMNRRKKKIEMR